MGDKSRIEWTDATWNPAYGCDKVSPGCANCYAEGYAKRFRGGVPFDVITLHEDRIDLPTRWQRGRKIFLGSLTDPFHAKIPTAQRDAWFLQMAVNSRHTFQIPTKRPELAEAYLNGLIERPTLVGTALNAAHVGRADYAAFGPQIPNPAALAALWPLPNVWIGVSVENQTWADRRLPVLERIPAAVRFVSFEPLIGPIDGKAIAKWIDWVIVGGESGPNCRPMALEWALTLYWASRKTGARFFMKQLGGWPKKRDAMTDFPPVLQVREFPRAA